MFACLFLVAVAALCAGAFYNVAAWRRQIHCQKPWQGAAFCVCKKTLEGKLARNLRSSASKCFIRAGRVSARNAPFPSLVLVKIGSEVLARNHSFCIVLLRDFEIPGQPQGNPPRFGSASWVKFGRMSRTKSLWIQLGGPEAENSRVA